MTKESIFEKLAHIVSDKLGTSLEAIKFNSHFMNDLGADSLDQMELIMGVEDGFAVNINDHDAQKLQTVADVVDYLLAALALKDSEKASEEG